MGSLEKNFELFAHSIRKSVYYIYWKGVMVAKKVNQTKKSKAAVKKTKAKKTIAKGTAMKKATKKSVAKKTKTVAAIKSKPVKKKTKAIKKSRLSKASIKKFTAMLLEKLKELTGDVTHIEKGALRTSRLDAAGDLSSMPIHMADMGTDNFEQEFALGLMDSERKLLREIYAALERINGGTYGICEGTGKAIQKARLEASPWSRYCIEYATMVEKGLVIEGEKIYDEDEEEEFDEDNKLDEEEVDSKTQVLDDEYSNFGSTREDDF